MDEFSGNIGRSSTARFRRTSVAAATVLMGFMGAAVFESIANAAMQDDKAPRASSAQGDTANELAELGQTLKAAVLSGTLSEADAIKIHNNMARSFLPENAKKMAGAAKEADGPYAAKLDIMMLAAPRPGRITALFQPEFLQRDLLLLRRELDLDRDQMAIIGILLSDYLEAFELASMPVREALGRYRRSSSDQWVAAALERANIAEVDVAVANTKDALQQFEGAAGKKETVDASSSNRAPETDRKREVREVWARRMVEVTATMEDRLAAIRERVHARLREMELTGSAVTGDDLVAMARELRGQRAQLREEITELLGIVALTERSEAERARFEAAVARVRIEHVLNHGRLGGESMNLWAALIETTRMGESRRGRTAGLDEVEARLNERAPALAATLNDRTEATIDRELRGLEFVATRDRISAATGTEESGAGIDPARLASAVWSFAVASRREVAASVAVRDVLIAMLDESSALIETDYPDTNASTVYRDAALRRGFRTEMRQRWSERALGSALRQDDLDDETRTALVAIESEVAVALRALRTDAIAERTRRDPRRAIERIEVQFETEGSRREKFDLDDLLGFNHQAYTALDERIEDQLQAILTPEQWASMPARLRSIKGGKGKAGK